MNENNYTKWIIGLLILIIILQLMIKFPIQIEIKETNCPEIICKEVYVEVNCNCLNGTLIPETNYWKFPSIYHNIINWNYSNNINYYDNIEFPSIYHNIINWNYSNNINYYDNIDKHEN